MTDALSDAELDALTPNERQLYFRGMNAGIAQGYEQGVKAATQHLRSLPSKLVPAELSTPLQELELTVRAFNCLTVQANLHSIDDVLTYAASNNLLSIPNFNRACREELRRKLRGAGYTLPEYAGND
jgi:DNA-directed RNA polymerase alpha subunit